MKMFESGAEKYNSKKCVEVINVFDEAIQHPLKDFDDVDNSINSNKLHLNSESKNT